MPQLDRFLSVLVSSRAESLLLVENGVANLQKDGVARPVTQQPITGPQLLQLLREIAPADVAPQLAQGGTATFRYSSSDGAFTARVTQEGGRWQALIAPDPTAPAAAASAPAAAAAAAPPTAAEAAPRATIESHSRRAVLLVMLKGFVHPQAENSDTAE